MGMKTTHCALRLAAQHRKLSSLTCLASALREENRRLFFSHVLLCKPVTSHILARSVTLKSKQRSEQR